MNKFVKDRHDAFISAVVDDDWSKVKRYSKKYGVPMPKGHGDLIDRTKIGKAIPAEEDNCTGMGMTYDEMYAYNDGIDAMYDKVQRVSPIIEADEEVIG